MAAAFLTPIAFIRSHFFFANLIFSGVTLYPMLLFLQILTKTPIMAPYSLPAAPLCIIFPFGKLTTSAEDAKKAHFPPIYKFFAYSIPLNEKSDFFVLMSYNFPKFTYFLLAVLLFLILAAKTANIIGQLCS